MSNSKLTVALTRYGETDDLVKECLGSLSSQMDCTLHVLFLDQKCSSEIKNFCDQISSKEKEFSYIEIPAKSLSYARNYGIEKATTDYLAFCDSDCILAENWANEIVKTFADTGAAIVGTKIIPRWESRISWYHNSRFIQEFYSLIDLADMRIPIGKVIGASFAIDKAKISDEIRFDEHLDRQKGTLLSGGDTEFCERVHDSGGLIIYTPYTYANHVVPKERINLGWILKRAYYGGLSRSIRKGKIEPFNKKRGIVDYFAILMILPSYILGYIVGKFK